MISESRKKEWINQTQTIVESYDVQCNRLTNWEVEFIDSIEIQLSQGKELSFKQSSALRKIFDRIE